MRPLASTKSPLVIAPWATYRPTDDMTAAIPKARIKAYPPFNAADSRFKLCIIVACV